MSLIFKARQFEFIFPRPTLVMAVLNVTPDSFSDGGKFQSLEAAVARGLELASQGADILDIGGESTRPGAGEIPESEELARVIPVVRALSRRLSIPLSIDTRKPGVAAAAMEAGAALINDIGANREDPAMWRVVASTGAGYVCMHMQGSPATMQIAPSYPDVAESVASFFEERLQKLRSHGVGLDAVALDPGIGFGKTDAQNLQLLRQLPRFRTLGRPLLLGLSRKSFIGRLLGVPVYDRLPASLACASLAAAAGVQMIRTHDVGATKQALRMTEAWVADGGVS